MNQKVGIYIDGFLQEIRDDLDPDTPTPSGVEILKHDLGPRPVPIDPALLTGEFDIIVAPVLDEENRTVTLGAFGSKKSGAQIEQEKYGAYGGRKALAVMMDQENRFRLMESEEPFTDIDTFYAYLQDKGL